MSDKINAWFYDPVTGEGRIFTSKGDIPKGWLDHVPTADDKKVVTRKAMTKDEITGILDEGGIEYKKNASAGDLHDLLVDAVHRTLVEQGTEFDSNADVRDLIPLLKV